MKVGMIALIAALVMLAVPAWAGPADPCGSHPTDGDSDTVCDALDNCSEFADAPSCDTDSDGYGNGCDGDFDNNGIVGLADFTTFFLGDFIAGVDSGIGSDGDCGGTIGLNDFTVYFLGQFLAGAPGPSGLSCAGTVSCP